jgi:hypothetical protein
MLAEARARHWVPAFAGMSGRGLAQLRSFQP